LSLDTASKLVSTLVSTFSRQQIWGEAEETPMLNEMSYLQLKRLTGEEEEVLISEHKQLKKALGR
jgi:hypothetical protein